MNNSDVIKDTHFDFPKKAKTLIKVIGVGGGGSNAVNYMYSRGVRCVEYIVCNTDAQALEKSPVPNKIQLGKDLTKGLGAGAKPQMGQDAAVESMALIEEAIGEETEMVFITAGMGGGTGTGASPVIARICKQRGILVVAIVTFPFDYEGIHRRQQAQKGLEALSKNVDALIVVNNEKLSEIYGDLGYSEAFAKADEVLATGGKGITDLIVNHYTVNIDMRDVRTILADSGNAIMGSGRASGPDRALKAVRMALDSPLLNDNTIYGAKDVLFPILTRSKSVEPTMAEIKEMMYHIQEEAGSKPGEQKVNVIFGIGVDETLEEELEVTVIATGFKSEFQSDIINSEKKKIYHTIDGANFNVKELDTNSHFTNISFQNMMERREQNKTASINNFDDLSIYQKRESVANDENVTRHNLEEYINHEEQLTKATAPNFDDEKTEKVHHQLKEEVSPSINDARQVAANNFNASVKKTLTQKEYEELASVPAYMRAGMRFGDIQNIQKPSRSSVVLDENNEPKIRTNNTFLFDRVD